MSSVNQPLKPLEYISPITVEKKSTIVNLDLCQWRYPKKVITAFNDYQTKNGKKYKMSYQLSNWQKSDNILN